jgi:hypothetical protein
VKETQMPEDDYASNVQKIRAVLAKKDKLCPVTQRILRGEGTWRCALEAGHAGDHEGLYTGNSAYLRRVAERIAENLCVRDGTVAWKSTEGNALQGWDDSIEILQELISVAFAQQRGFDSLLNEAAPRGTKKRPKAN